MKIYSVHVPATSAPGLSDQVHFERQGFSWLAFLFGPFWLACRGFWRALALWCVIAALIGLAVGFRGLSGGTAAGLFLIIELYLGLQGAELADAALERSGWPLSDVAAGADRVDAERGFFSRRVRQAQQAPSGRQLAVSPSTPSSVIGLFPEAGG
jgi:Protein of unknown function (DUF2628)